MKTQVLSFCYALSLFGFASGAVTINYSNDNAPGFELKDQNGVPLTSGLANKQRDGAKFEVGYYSLATSSNPFAGEWVPMVSPDVISNYITIGDREVNDASGIFQGVSIIGSDPAGGYALPAQGTLLSIRFYNTKAYAPGDLYNAVSSTEWVWLGVDPDSMLEMDLTDAVLVWEGGEASAFRTTLPVPEASASMLAMVAGAALLVRRKIGSE